MTSAHICAQAQETCLVHSSVAGLIFQPAGYELDTPKTAEVKLPVSGANWDADGLAIVDGLDRGDADGNVGVDGDGVAGVDGATAPGPVGDCRKGPTTARTNAPAAITAAAARAALADMFMAWNLRGTRISTRR